MSTVVAKWSLKIASAVLITLLFAGAGLFVTMRLIGMRFLTVVTNSMQPMLNPGDLVIVKPQKNVEVGQVVTYNSTTNPGELITHRVRTVDKTRDVLVTKGDNTDLADAPIRQHQIIGIISWNFRGGGKLIAKLRSPVGLILPVYVPALAVVTLELRRLLNSYHKSRHYSASNIKYN